MLRKSLATFAALALATSVASADTIALSFDGTSQWSGTFTSLSSGATSFTFDLSSLTGWTNISITSVISAGYAGPNGYDVTSVTFDGAAFTPLANVSVPGFGVDAWTFSAANIAAGPHTLVVTGNLIGGATGFDGKLTIQAQPVPEPETYALLLAGLGVVGVIARRRSAR